MEALRLLAVYGASCLAILWLVHRTLRPVPPAVALVLLLLPMAFTGRAMVTGSFYGPLNLAYGTPPLLADQDQLPEDHYENGILMDQVCQVVPWRKAVRESVKTGHWPLWNRFARGGDVLMAASQPAPFDPKVWLGFLLPLAMAITFACSFVFFQAACFTWLYLRELDLADGPALVGAAAYMASQFLTFWVGWSMSSVWAVMPLLLLGVHRLAHGRRGGFGTALAAATLALVGGHPESVLHISAVAGIVLLMEWPYRLGLAGAWPRLRRTLLAALAAGALAAPALLPFAEAMVQTADFRIRQNTEHAHSLPLGEALGSAQAALFPWALGRPWHTEVAVKPSRFDDASGAYVGGLALILALAVFLNGRAAERPGVRRRIRLYGALALLSLAAASGIPWIADAIGALPLFSLSLNGRLAAITAFSLSVLAAFSAAGLGRAEGAASGSEWRHLAPGLGLLALLGALVGSLGDLPLEAAVLFLRSLPWTLVPGALLLSLILRPSVRVRLQDQGGRLLWPLLLVLVLVPRIFETPDFYRAFPSQLFFPPVAELAEIPDFQTDGSEPYRVVGTHSDLVPATSALWELEDPRGYNVMRHDRQRRTLSLWCDRSTAWWFCQVHDVTRPFLSAINVRYALADPARPQMADWHLVTRGEHLSIWENPRALPRAFAPDTLLRVDLEAEIPKQIRQIPDFQAVAVIETDRWPSELTRAGRGANDDFRTNSQAEVHTRADGPDLVIEVDAEGPAWIVVSETPWRGWRATNDEGRRLDLTHANVSMLAFHVEPGRHTIRLAYRPASFFAGLVVALLALLALAAAWFAGRRARAPRPV